MIIVRGVGKKTIYLEPVVVIEWIISICTLIGGLYLFSPLYRAADAAPGALVNIFSHPVMIFFWGAVLLIGAIMVIFGLVTRQPQFKSAGWFAIFLARTFQIISTFIVAGLFPLTWIYPFTLLLVVMVLWTLARIEVSRNANT